MQHVFWTWFRKNAPLLARTQEHSVPDVSSALANCGVSDLGWEIGPCSNSDNLYIAITLNGSLENLPLARELVRDCSDVAGWEILVGRPPKPLDQSFTFRNESGSVEIDAANWTYALEAFDDGTFDIEVFAPGRPRMDARAKLQVLGTILQAATGEMRFHERIGEFRFQDTPSDAWRNRASPLADLSAHLDYLSDAPSDDATEAPA